MPYVGTDFPSISPGAVNVAHQLDFLDFINPGEQLTGATWTCRAMPGFAPDASAQSRVQSPGVIASVPGNPDPDLITATYTTVSNPVAGARYELKAAVTTNQGATYDLWSYVSCDPDPAA